ncbi:MAG: hypothetical protein GXP08_06130 [Gammaproteobacteria bacterium]|nr:hypothetical protein [Gammaproteobacteria bacterium]
MIIIKRAKGAIQWFAVVSLFLLSGCATTSIFSSYPSQILPLKQQLINKQYKVVQDSLEKHRSSKDKILYLMERGRASQMAGDNQASIEDFKEVIAAMDVNEDKASVSLSETASQGTALLTNDNAIPYSGEDYERVFVHHFQAMNYLFSNDINAALVEVRRANEQQKLAFIRHEDEIAEAEEKQSQNNSQFMDSFSALDTAAGRVKNSFQNAYTFYASGVLYEVLGSFNDAYIDYKKALEIFPDNVFLQQDVLRLSKELGMREDYEQFKAKFTFKPQHPKGEEGEIIVFFEHGFAPVKQQVKVPFYAGQNNVHTAAFPIYDAIWQNTSPLNLSFNGGAVLGETRPIVYVQALAAKALKERLPGMLIRQVLRVTSKKQMVDKTSGFAQLAIGLLNIVSENADQRSWLTLPNDAQIFRGYLPVGEHDLLLSNGTASGTMSVKVEAGKRTIVRIIATDTTLHTNAVTL